MRYEPIEYILEYEMCAIIFLVVIMTRFFAARRFPNQKNRLFAIILWVVLADMSLDIIGSVVIKYTFSTPLYIIFAVNGLFYSLQIILPLLMTIYTLALLGYLSRKRMRRLVPLFLPGVLLLLAMFLNPITHWFFYVDPVRGYIHGKVFIITYLACFFYMVATFLIAFINRSKMRKAEYMTIFRFLAITLAAMLAQYLYPPLLISGVAIALSVILMYFTIQNPDSMVDATSGAFTYEAMLTFLRDMMWEHSQVQLIAVKVQNMSRINELLGIENGSLLLRQLSNFLRTGADDSWVFRMRGSCFVAITRKKADFELLKEKADKRVGEAWMVGDIEIMLQASLCHISPEEMNLGPISPEDAVDYIETALTHSEELDCRIKSLDFDADMLEKIKRRRAVEEALRVALVDGEGFELYFQPIWSVKKETFTAAEVLLRFKHPIMGFIPPDEFVPVAESNGLVTALDEMVVRKACAFLQDNEHCRLLGLEKLEINLSALEFMHHRLPELLGDIMSDSRVDPSFICFEITETAATESFELFKDCMSEICAFGCEFALDDFGTGYANIAQVISLPFSTVKLDKSLLYGPCEVIEDMARMFARLERSTVAEGAETAEQTMLLRSFNVDFIQGYYYAHPMNREDFLSFLRSRQSEIVPSLFSDSEAM